MDINQRGDEQPQDLFLMSNVAPRPSGDEPAFSWDRLSAQQRGGADYLVRIAARRQRARKLWTVLIVLLLLLGAIVAAYLYLPWH